MDNVKYFESNTGVQTIVRELRDANLQKDRHRFRGNLRRLGTIMAYEISSQLYGRHDHIEVTTPLGIKKQSVLGEYPVIVNVLRAANCFVDGFLEVFRQSDVSFIAAARNEETLETTVYYEAVQDIEGKDIVIPDVMLATGASSIAALDVLERYGTPKKIYLAFAIAAPEGVEALKEKLKGVKSELFLGSIDDCLNDKGYIVPGLGDAGDLCYGSKFKPGED